RVDAATSGRPLSTLETVGIDTPASLAIWAIVVAAAPSLVIGWPGLSCASFALTLALRVAEGEDQVSAWSGASCQVMACGLPSDLCDLYCAGCGESFERLAKLAIAHDEVMRRGVR